MNQEKVKKGQKTVKTHQEPSSVHCSVVLAALSSSRLLRASLQRGLSLNLLGHFELLFLVSFKSILPSILASELTLPSLLRESVYLTLLSQLCRDPAVGVRNGEEA